jgi:hypothetical protein
LNRFIFGLLPKRAIVVTGTYEHYGDSLKLTLHQEEQPSFVAEGTKATQIAELVDSVVYQLIAANWVSTVSASWPAIKYLTEGLEQYSAFIAAADYALLPKAVELFRKAVDGSPAWPTPKLFLGWVLFIENQNKAASDAAPALQEAAALFDDVAFNAPQQEISILGRLAALHVYSHIIRTNLSRCNEIVYTWTTL